MRGWTRTATMSSSADLTPHHRGIAWVTKAPAGGKRPFPAQAEPPPGDPVLGAVPVASTDARLILPQQMRLPDQSTQVGQTSLKSHRCPRLDEDVPDGRGLDGPGHGPGIDRRTVQLAELELGQT